jgi:hypothetical protein
MISFGGHPLAEPPEALAQRDADITFPQQLFYLCNLSQRPNPGRPAVDDFDVNWRIVILLEGSLHSFMANVITSHFARASRAVPPRIVSPSLPRSHDARTRCTNQEGPSQRQAIARTAQNSCFSEPRLRIPLAGSKYHKLSITERGTFRLATAHTTHCV